MAVQILFGVCAVIVSLACVAVAVHVWLRPRHLEDDALADWIKNIERNVNMLRGRVNRLHPPRLGTGEGDGSPEDEIVAPAASQEPPSSKRSEVLSAWRKRRGL